jgi:hypothetical protein
MKNIEVEKKSISGLIDPNPSVLSDKDMEKLTSFYSILITIDQQNKQKINEGIKKNGQ